MKEQNTKSIILKAALKLFMEHGFAGTSMSRVAQSARVNKSLIYHHFVNKETLWREVKLDLLQSYTKEFQAGPFSTQSLHDFIEDAVTFRFNFYSNRPQIARLMMWQRLEKKQASLQGVKHPVFASFMPQIVELQQAGKLNPHLDPDMVEYVIMSMAASPIIDNPDFLRGAHRTQAAKKYVDFLIYGLVAMLAP